MRIDTLTLENFRCFEHLELNLDPQFNLLVGENGSGKTAILEALTIAMSGLFLELKDVEKKYISQEDVRFFSSVEGSFEWAYPTVITSQGIVQDKSLQWKREKPDSGRKTQRQDGQSPIKKVSEDIENKLRDYKRTEILNLPILAYYSTARLWWEKQERKKRVSKDEIPSRYRGYQEALGAKSTFKILLDWLQAEYRDASMNKGVKSDRLLCLENVIVKSSDDFDSVEWVFSLDVKEPLFITFKDGRKLPFSYLSDGYRNILAMFADLAWRCVTLNPHFGAEATELTEGIVLIDELDLHLHPSWQRNIIGQLKKTFPKIQFVATTHSPFLIQQTEGKELIILKENESLPPSSASNLALEDVAEQIQGVEEVNMSKQKEAMFNKAKEFYQLLDQLTPDKSEMEKSQLQKQVDAMRDELNLLSKDYVDNVAYMAFLEQEKLVAESRIKNSQ